MFSKSKSTHLLKISLLLPAIRLLFSAFTTVPIQLNDPNFLHSFCFKFLKLYTKTGFLREGKQFHSLLMKLGLYNVLSLQNQLLNFYVKCYGFEDAWKLFDEMGLRNVVTLNTLICGSVNCGRFYKSNLSMIFTYVNREFLYNMRFDSITLNGLLRGCLEINDICIGRQLHCLILKSGFESSCFVNSALVDFYGKCGFVAEARRVFDKVVRRDLVIWNVMLSCYALNFFAEDAFRDFNSMRLNFIGDCFTFSIMLNSCATLSSCELGKQIHGLVIKLSFDLDTLVAAGLVDMYAKSETIDDARKVFDHMDTKNVVSWNTMLVAYGKQGDGVEAMKLLKKMLRNDFAPDELTLASVMSSASFASTAVMQVHGYVVKNGFQSFPSIESAMISAYSKCGRTASALECFNLIQEPNVIAWTSLISAYALSSLPEHSIKIFETMLAAGIRPDHVAFLGVLSACSHAGFVKEGLHYFELMVKIYQISPTEEHYACLVDLLGRAGLLDEAFVLLSSLPVEHSNSLGAFIGACKLHGHVKFAKWAAEKLSDLEPNVPVNYALMSNIYASKGKWDDVARVRKLMRDKCDHKVPGCSWTELSGVAHKFVSSDKGHTRALEVYCMLESLFGVMRDECSLLNHYIFSSSHCMSIYCLKGQLIDL